MFEFEKFRPLGDRVLVKRLEGEDKTSSGIYLPDAAKDKPQTGVVLAVGPGKVQDGKLSPLAIKVNDVVYFGKYSGTDAGNNHLIIKEDDILGVVEQ